VSTSLRGENRESRETGVARFAIGDQRASCSESCDVSLVRAPISKSAW
jgi:hypothetical protein